MLYSATCPAINQSRAGLSVYPGGRSAASTCCRRASHDLPGHKLKQGRSPIVRSRAAPRETHMAAPREAHMAANQMKRVQGDWSPWRSLGRAAPAFSRREAQQSQCDCVKRTLPRRTAPVPQFRITHSAFRIAPAVPRVPSEPRRNRQQETPNPKVNPQTPITAPTHENALLAIPTHAGIET